MEMLPFRLVSGRVAIEGPEEADVDRELSLPPGHYRLVVAQAVAAEEDRERVDLFFEQHVGLHPETISKARKAR
jgi:hypothetical protein